jgi:uncharacterized protein YqjF (DUF2071 family)
MSSTKPLSIEPTLDDRLATRVPPPGRPVMHHRWRELLFLHWRYPADALQALLPKGLTIDLFDGEAWLGVVPFFMCNIRPRWCPPVPGISNFQELNLRTYAVDRTGRPGVWFLSLDANQRLAVWAGRRFFGLPYQNARMSHEWNPTSGHVQFLSQRVGSQPRQTCRFDYQPAGPARTADPGTLEYFLIERYWLFAQLTNGVLKRGQVCHDPYEFSDVELRHWDEHLIELAGLPLPGRPPDHAAVSRGVQVKVHKIEPITA